MVLGCPRSLRLVRFFSSFGKEERIAHGAERIAKDPKKARRKSRERKRKQKKARSAKLGAGGKAQKPEGTRREEVIFRYLPPFWFIPY
jgi:hypothetical protein